MVTSHHTITLYPTLIKQLTKRGWTFAGRETRYGIWAYTKRHGKYAYVAQVDFGQHRATFSRYQRITSSQQEIS